MDEVFLLLFVHKKKDLTFIGSRSAG